MPAASEHAADPASPSTPLPDSADAPGEGTALFHERVLAGPGLWIAAVGVGAALGLILVPLHLTVAIIVGAVSILALLALVVVYSPVVEVADGWFRLGRARIEVQHLGEPTALSGEVWARTIGQDFEPLAHHCVRGWTRTGLRVEVLDEDDPATAWVASTRRPDDLVLALRTAQRLQARSQD